MSISTDFNSCSIKKLSLPLSERERTGLKCGEIIELSGEIYTARDAAHKRICEAIKVGSPLPFDLNNAAVYYCGPTPTIDNEIIGSCGPTTSARMDDYTPLLLENGLKIMIGKGSRSKEVIESMKKNKAVYFAAVGGAAALIKSKITQNKYIAYNDLGCEEIRQLTIKDLKLVVATDSEGKSVF